MEETDTKMYPKRINKNLKKTEKASTYKIKQLYKKSLNRACDKRDLTLWEEAPYCM